MSVLYNARSLYLEGIGGGDYDTAIDKYSGVDYVQHSTGVATGQPGFKQFFADFTKRNPVREMKIIHSFEEENLAFLFVIQNLNNIDMWVTMDIFKGDEDDKLIEHWDVIEEFKLPINHQFKIIPNNFDLKQVVLDNLQTFNTFIGNNKYQYANHKSYQIMQADNYVAMLSGFESKKQAYAQISLFEFDQENLVGFWSTTEPIIPEIANNSGKF